MSATLNQDDIKLLKSVFATKDDLVAMEKRQDAKYVTKNDLSTMEKRVDSKLVAMEKRQDAKYATKDDLKQFATRVEIKQMIEESENSIIQAVTGVEIELRSRINRLEDTVGISAAN